MKIAINVWVLRKKELDGIGTVTKETVTRIIKNHPEVDFLLLCDKNFREDYFDFPNARLCHIFPPFRHPVLYLFYLEVIIPIFLLRHKVDLLLSLDGMASLGTRTPQVVCIHDINFIHQPQDLDLKNRIYYGRSFPRFARKAARIATVSQYSKVDISQTFAVPQEKIDVIYCGVKSGLRPYSIIEQETTRLHYTKNQPYFLFVGTLHPRKNIKRLLTAYDYFKTQTPSTVSLVIVGNFMWDAAEINDTYAALVWKKDIHITGRVTEDELSALYGAALAITFVPTFEGFGLPIIEGFTAGVPVITSNVTSMPEVAGDAALLVNPFDEKDIAGAMRQIFENRGDIRQEMIDRGFQQAKKFSWDDTSKRLWDCTLKALAQ